MTPALLRRTRLLLNTAVVALLLPANARAQTASQQSAPTTLPSEIAAHLKVATATWDCERREVMIPTRAGVRRDTVILGPTGATNAPILRTRTPYARTGRPSDTATAH